MDSTDIVKHLDTLHQQAERLHKSAHARRGQKAHNKPSRSELEHQLYLMRTTATSRPQENQIRNTFVGEAYPPSTEPLAHLSPISISDLHLETHHRGKVLIVRTFALPASLVSAQNVIESENGDVDRLAIYNVDPSADPSDILPKGAFVAIKEPYYKATADGGSTVRVDHPSDLVQLQPDHDLVPLKWRKSMPSRSAEEYKKEGNNAFKQKNYRRARELYSFGLAQCGDEDATLQKDLYRNRSLVNYHGGAFEKSLQDAEASIISSTELDEARTQDYNVKAFYRAGTAAYKLRMFADAAAYFEKALALRPDEKDAQRELKRTKARLSERSHCQYDLDQIARDQIKQHIRVDCGDYISQTEIRQTPQRGRGLFATVEIPAGAIVMCEKAFEVVLGSDKFASVALVVNINTKRGSMGTHSTLQHILVRKLSSNPALASRFFGLYDGNYGGDTSCPIVDGTAVVDAFRTQQISEYNRFGCDNQLKSDPSKEKLAAKADIDNSVGVWVHASHINHDCLGNICRAFLGDLMIVRATRTIAKGEELLLQYQPPNPVYSTSQKKFETTWGFKCTCALCKAEAASSHLQLERRQKVHGEIEDFLSKHQMSGQGRGEKKLVSTGEALYENMRNTYDAKLFQEVPRVGIIALGCWLCRAYNFYATQERVFKFAREVLGEIEIIVPPRATKDSQVKRKGGTFGQLTVDVAVYAAHARFSSSPSHVNDAEGQVYLRLAKQLHTECNGSVLGFDERYGG